MTPNTPMTELSEKVASVKWSCDAVIDSGYEHVTIGANDWKLLSQALSQSLRAPAGEVGDNATLTSATTRIQRAERERDEARDIVRQIYWMAVRYADGRMSYAPGMCNDAIRKAYDAGWLSYSDDRQHDLDPQYAREGNKPEYRGLEARATAAEAQLADAVKVLEEIATGRDAEGMKSDFPSIIAGTFLDTLTTIGEKPDAE